MSNHSLGIFSILVIYAMFVAHKIQSEGFHLTNQDVNMDALHATYEGSYFGFVTTMDVYGFQINNGQRIVSSIWIVNRGGNDGDEKNEIMIGWQRDSTRTTGCYDMKCPGFELTPGSPLAPGDVIRPVSDVNGARQKITIKVFRDKPTGNWWKHYGFNRASAATGCYYPASLFTTLTEKATNILFGGSALAVDGVPSPAMGSGSLPSIMSDRAASMEGISLIDEDGRVAPFDAETIKTETMSFCYAMTPIFGANSSRIEDEIDELLGML
uniref:Neprosin PEP catalytic domain-containing protein n=1 Tax=Oryza brachyantha TaxID=4533 RepID=J3NDD4_ORYBR